MTTLLEQAFTAASALPQTEQDAIAHDIFRRLEARKKSRRSLLKMPLEQRRQILAQQAEKMVEHYQQNPEWKELGAGDILEYSHETK
ncbi:hypothetical protein [Pseudanabaena yagii]|uniref:Uncharacterized protein n=1 Tax=Pseudanabaena yagii GIHE-NHR1 TaxID=2722753 RepID=A0ABX1LQR2_9CYAN|nr:hypothetical protein [Pseudanabaena yagii]NMF58463.1 hypothetical protein [Pseudanabaena yagii GIHE-NHR1]